MTTSTRFQASRFYYYSALGIKPDPSLAGSIFNSTTFRIFQKQKGPSWIESENGFMVLLNRNTAGIYYFRLIILRKLNFLSRKLISPK